MGHRVVRVVHVFWQPDNQCLRLPLLDQTRDMLPVWPSPTRTHGGEILGESGMRAADGNADGIGTVVKGKEERRGLHARRGAEYQACPASVDNNDKSTPASCAAFCQRCSTGVSKRICWSAGPLSQEFSAISRSSWPAPQPA